MNPKRPASMSLLVLVGATMHASMVAAQSLPAPAVSAAPRDVLFPTFQVDGGVTRDFERHRWQGLIGAAAGVGLYDGNRLWELTAGAQGMRRAINLSIDRASVETGLGVHATALWDLNRGAAGIGAGGSFSLLHVQASVVFDHVPAAYVAVFLRVPVGFLIHVALHGRR